MSKIEEIETNVDNNLQNAGTAHKSRRKVFKIIGVLFIATILTTTAIAGVLQYYAKWDVQLTIKQAVTVTGGPLTYSGMLSAGCCEVLGPYTATNNGCDRICLRFITQEVTDPAHLGPVPEGIIVHAVECIDGQPTPVPCYLDSVKLRVLDGQATGDDDDYSVYVDGQFVGSYNASEGGDETWVESFFDISALEIEACGTHTIKVVCDAVTPWAGYATWGQLAVDYIKLYRDCPNCVEPVLCDSVDIGDQDDEATHNLVGWSDFIAGSGYNGGNYGGIDDARCTWFGTETTAQSWATVDLTCSCENCGEIPDGNGECDCNDPDIGIFCLEQGESINFCLTYHADIMMPDSGPYKLETTLVPSQI